VAEPANQQQYVPLEPERRPGAFAVNTGVLTPLGGTVVGINPAGSDNLDIAISTDGNILYSLNSAGGAIGAFAVNADGSLACWSSSWAQAWLWSGDAQLQQIQAAERSRSTTSRAHKDRLPRDSGLSAAHLGSCSAWES
jgi:hypothetical protein